ncbi:alpha/beta fold hydrolase [Paraglaciecola aestuariivivens]
MAQMHHQIYSEDPTKPWIVLIHGLFGDLANLTGLRRFFSATHQVLAVDLLDHGLSAHTDSFSFETNAQAILALLNQLKISQPTIIGHSLGGKVAMQLALTAPDKVNRLVVLDIAPVAYPPRHAEVFAGLKAVDLANLTSRKEADQTLAKYVLEQSTRQFLLKSLYQNNQQWLWRFNLPMLDRDYAKLSAEIAEQAPYPGPVLFLKGQLSDYLLAEHKPAVLKLFPNSQSKVVHNTGHWLHAEKPEIVAKVIQAFLNQ